MEITLEWTEEDIEHIKRHNIEPKDVESIFESRIYYRRRKEFYDFLGVTKGGRILFVVLERLKAHTYRVAIARDATPTEKNLYVKRGK